MSTQEIRRLIDAVADSHGEGRVRLALAEVEAIEKAGRYGYLMMTGDIHMAKKDEERAASEAFSAIYEQTGRSEE